MLLRAIGLDQGELDLALVVAEDSCALPSAGSDFDFDDFADRHGAAFDLRDFEVGPLRNRDPIWPGVRPLETRHGVRLYPPTGRPAVNTPQNVQCPLHGTSPSCASWRVIGVSSV